MRERRRGRASAVGSGLRPGRHRATEHRPAGTTSARRPFVLYHPGRAALLVADGPAPEGFTTLEDVPASLRGRAHVAVGRVRGLDGNIDLTFPVGGREVTAVPYAGDLANTLDLLFHEAFHQTQLSRFQDISIPAGDTFPEVARPEVERLLEVERRLLADAVEAGTPLDTLLAEAVGFADLDAEARGALARAAIARVRPERPGHAAAATRDARPAASPTGLRLRVEIPIVDGGRQPRLAVNTSEMLRYMAGATGRPELTSLGAPARVSVAADGVDLVVRERPVWVDQGDASRLVVLIALAEWPTVNGLDPRELSGLQAGPLRLAGPGLRGEIDGGAEIGVDGEVLVLRVRPP